METSPTTSKRESWLDYVRFFSIFLVIFYHTPPRQELFDEAIVLNLRLPVFFCVSGYLFNHRRWTDFRAYATHRGRQILVPYVLFFAVFYALWLVFGRQWLGSEEMQIDILLPLREFVTGNPQTVVAPFWYIICLLTMQLLYFWLARWVTVYWIMPVTVAISATACLISWEGPWMHLWNIGHALVFMPFYAFGHSCHALLRRLSFRGQRRTFALICTAVASMGAMACVLAESDPSSGIFNLARVLCGLMVVPAYLCLGKWVAARLGPRRFVSAVVMGGTIYLGLQNYVIGAVRLTLDHALGAGWLAENMWMRPLVAVLVMAAIYPISSWILHHAPWVIGRDRPQLP